MHARIGPSRALWQYVFAGNPSNSRGQRALNAGGTGLDLPATEIGAVVGQDQFQIAHRQSKSESCEMLLHPRLHRSTGFERAVRFVGYTVAFSKTPDRGAFCAKEADRGTLGRLSA